MLPPTSPAELLWPEKSESRSVHGHFPRMPCQSQGSAFIPNASLLNVFGSKKCWFCSCQTSCKEGRIRPGLLLELKEKVETKLSGLERIIIAVISNCLYMVKGHVCVASSPSK